RCCACSTFAISRLSDGICLRAVFSQARERVWSYCPTRTQYRSRLAVEAYGTDSDALAYARYYGDAVAKACGDMDPTLSSRDIIRRTCATFRVLSLAAAQSWCLACKSRDTACCSRRISAFTTPVCSGAYELVLPSKMELKPERRAHAWSRRGVSIPYVVGCVQCRWFLHPQPPKPRSPPTFQLDTISINSTNPALPSPSNFLPTLTFLHTAHSASITPRHWLRPQRLYADRTAQPWSTPPQRVWPPTTFISLKDDLTEARALLDDDPKALQHEDIKALLTTLRDYLGSNSANSRSLLSLPEELIDRVLFCGIDTLKAFRLLCKSLARIATPVVFGNPPSEKSHIALIKKTWKSFLRPPAILYYLNMPNI
ncbi:hypothetical protein B0J12DRAFT_758789, partial [Macrophomina phaseolina]